MKSRHLVTFLFLLLAPGLSWSLSDQQIETTIKQWISQRHPEYTQDDWRSLGEGAPAVIIRMHKATKNVVEQVRLLQGLAFFDSEEGASYLEDQIESTDNAVVRNKSIRALGISQGMDAASFISKYLDHSNPNTRVEAASTLKWISENFPNESKGIEKSLQEYRSQEKEKWVLAKLDNRPLPKPVSIQPPPPPKPWKKWVGTWKGFWLSPPIPKNYIEVQDGFVADRVKLSMTHNSQSGISGQLEVSKGLKIRFDTRKKVKHLVKRKYVLKLTETKGDQIVGTVSKMVKGKMGDAIPISGARRVLKKGNTQSEILEIQIDGLIARVVLRRET